MRVAYVSPTEKDWEDFFMGEEEDDDGQIGGKLDKFEGIRYQRGYGLGSFFGGLLRTLLPFAKSVGKTVGKQALRTGTAIAGDVVAGKTPKEAIEEHGKAGIERLVAKGIRKLQRTAGRKQQQKGEGFGMRPRKRVAQGTMKGTAKKTIKRKKLEDRLGFYYS